MDIKSSIIAVVVVTLLSFIIGCTLVGLEAWLGSLPRAGSFLMGILLFGMLCITPVLLRYGII